MKPDTLMDLLAWLVSEQMRSLGGSKASQARTYRIVRSIAVLVGEPRPTDEECERVYQGER